MRRQSPPYEKLKLKRVPSCGVIAGIGLVVSLLIQGIVSDWWDVLSIYICPLGADWQALCSSMSVEKNIEETQVNKGREDAAYQMVLSGLPVYICSGVLSGADTGDCPGRHWLINDATKIQKSL